ncbi:MAG: transketolase C-terminal domain-containing protein [Chloroflexota bacterium]|nr:alpha-ketoacid dehydrogenase subunit beta [Dehalococcoidia bacterium]MDW8254449.1 transketolase C-terminal domain-containing protein [Chloroflexota bacterium]
MAEQTTEAALAAAMLREMARDETVVVLGRAGGHGLFRVSGGAAERFGPDRAWNVPGSGVGLAGIAIGAALTGLRPVVELGTAEQAAPALSQIADHAAKLHFRSGGRLQLPLVFIITTGMTRSGPLRSQSLEAWFAHLPGLKVVMPATPADAAGLLRSAVRDDDPVVFVLDKRVARHAGETPDDEHAVPLGRAAVRRAGHDVTIVASGWMVHEALAAADDLAAARLSAEVIDVRSLVPLDLGTIVASVRKTGRLVVAHEAVVFAGIGAEIVASVVEAAPGALTARPRRVGLPFVVPPADVPSIALVLPSRRDIAGAALAVVHGR